MTGELRGAHDYEIDETDDREAHWEDGGITDEDNFDLIETLPQTSAGRQRRIAELRSEIALLESTQDFEDVDPAAAEFLAKYYDDNPSAPEEQPIYHMYE